ncbi:MAG: YfiM family protein [Gemmatimonadota bacterium]|nr:YfiM family protein [Gemmatimonadota bacterium]
MRRKICAIVVVAILACPRLASAEADSCGSITTNHETGRRVALGAAAVAGNATLFVYFKHAWWSGAPTRNWWVGNDINDAQFGNQDKFGHFFGGFQLTRLGTGALKVACISDRKAVLWAALYAYMSQFEIEVYDGTQDIYGFSPNDLAADVAGEMFGVVWHRTKWLQNIKPTFSYAPTAAERNRNLPGRGGEPRPSVDYAGQTYWFSADIHALLPNSAKPFWPSLIRLSVGHSITDFVDPATGAGLQGRRKILLSLDLDPEHLPGDSPVWRAIKHQLSFYHFPAPAFQFTPRARGIAWYR